MYGDYVLLCWLYNKFPLGDNKETLTLTLTWPYIGRKHSLILPTEGSALTLPVSPHTSIQEVMSLCVLTPAVNRSINQTLDLYRKLLDDISDSENIHVTLLRAHLIQL